MTVEEVDIYRNQIKVAEKTILRFLRKIGLQERGGDANRISEKT